MPLDATNLFDLVCAAALILSVILGFANGIVRELRTIAAFVLAIAATYWFAPKFLDRVEAQFPGQDYAFPVFLVAFFFVSIIIFAILLGIATRSMRNYTNGPVDRTMGAVFGLVRSILLISVAVIGITFAQGDDGGVPEWLAKARFFPVAAQVANLVKEILPHDSFMEDMEF